MKALPKVIIIGRANVGKSTLLNRLIEKPKALISNQAGTTRDINIGQVYWQGINFDLYDTGGVETILPKKKLKELAPKENADFAYEIINKTQAALKQADLILFVVDIQAGLLPQDKELAKNLKKLNKEIILVANKADSLKKTNKLAEFYKLGFKNTMTVSALNGVGTGDLLDEVVNKLKKIKKVRKANKIEIKNPIKITILGKPNVGKSSLLNAIIGQPRSIVSDLPFTTREAIDTPLEYKKQNIILIDTAGIRKKANIKKKLEKISVRKSLDNAKKADVCLLVIDIAQPITVQDNRLTKIILDSQVSLVIVGNKWDKIDDKNSNTSKKYTEYIKKMFPYLTWAPIIFTSALTTKNVHNVLDLALEVYQNRNINLPTSSLNRFLKQAIKKHKPSQAKGNRHPYLYDLKQVKTNPPVFELKIRKNDTLNNAYLKYLENSLREKFKITGTPLKIKLIK